MTEFPTSLELFERFCPKFEQVQLVPVGWRFESYKNTDKYCLLVYRNGVEVPWHSRYDTPMLKMKEAGLPVSFVYDPAAEGGIHAQFDKAVSEVIKSSLEGRSFRLVPNKPFTQLRGNGDLASQMQKVEVIGDPIPGLVLYEGGYQTGQQGHWDSFVPRGTPEAEAIQAALSWEYRQTLKPQDVATQQEEARSKLAEALSTLAD